MDSQPSAKNNLLDMMTPEEQARVKFRKEEADRRKEEGITREWMGLSELGFYYGWQAIAAVLDDTITLEQANMLIEGARKIHSGHVFDHSIASLAAVSGNKGSFEKLTKRYTDDMKAVN